MGRYAREGGGEKGSVKGKTRWREGKESGEGRGERRVVVEGGSKGENAVRARHSDAMRSVCG